MNRIVGLLTVVGLLAVWAIPATRVVAAQSDATAQSGATVAFTKAEDARVCGVQTLLQEHAQAIPDRLLHAISLVESGRWDNDRRASFAWPWTVTAEGEGHFLPSKDAAIAFVAQLKGKGVTNIDVGCMQVNLQAHPDAFANLDQAFDPATNVAYGARFLVELRAGTSDWETAGAYYHSQTPSLAASYKAKLIAAWSAARSHGDDRTAVAASTPAVEAPIGMILPTPAQELATPDARAAAFNAKAKETEAELAAAAGAQRAKTAAERAEAKRIADAYRAARVAEYRAHKLQLVDAHG